jgi:leucyl-tRNA synthetase
MFITFAFPYMNGPLHLGHLYTLLQGWIAGQRTGKPYLLPFGFHCTGMPIYASAQKLAAGDTKVKQMLLDMDIPEDEITRFHDPVYWVKYFPARAMKALKALDLPGLDLTRGFITTDLNPSFDSFVRWQFTRLKDKGLLYFGSRPCIYSVKDGQPCAAHDRQTGEDATIQEEEPEWIRQLPEKERAAYLERSHKNLFPSEKVISRSGDLCIVKYTEQWFIRYSDPEWKQKVVHYIKNELTIHDDEVKNNLLLAAENLHDWCFSREFGLGTKIPWDERFLIDSLSDSTIYPVYYQFVDLLEDLDGPQSVEFWEQVFSPTSKFKSKFKSKFSERIVAQDLRVSAKDLINNHLVMMIYNSIAIDERLLPREYRVNGYVRVNGEKMSKSLGNFVTVEQALERYPKNALLIALLEAGDGSSDANVRLADIQNIEKALKPQSRCNLNLKSSDSAAEYAQVLLECWTKSEEAWSRGRNREALAYGWRKAAKAYEKYSGQDPKLDNLCCAIINNTLHPIIGCEPILTAEQITAQLSNVQQDEHVIKLADYLKRLKKQINDGGKPRSITIHHGILAHPGNMERILSFLNDTEITINIDHTVIHPKRDPYKVASVIEY